MNRQRLGIVAALVCLLLMSATGFAAVLEPGAQMNLSVYEKLQGTSVSPFEEAPQLAELTAAGQLPPVADRLPKDPAVVIPVEQEGQYGGTWRRYGHLDWCTDIFCMNLWCGGRRMAWVWSPT